MKVSIFCFSMVVAINCFAQNKENQKIYRTASSADDSVTEYIPTPEESAAANDPSKQNKVFIMKTSATEETKTVPVNSATTDNPSKSAPVNVPKLSSGVEEEKPKPSPK